MRYMFLTAIILTVVGCLIVVNVSDSILEGGMM